jgi:hypothetical protein
VPFSWAYDPDEQATKSDTVNRQLKDLIDKKFGLRYGGVKR